MILTTRNRRRGRRRGATLVESALILVLFLSIVLGALDLGLAVFRHQLVSHLARRTARLAIVHGQFAPGGWYGGTWGTTTVAVTANAAGEQIVTALADANAFNGLDPANTNIQVEWLDGSVNPEVASNRVRATVTTTYTPMVTFVFGSPTWTLAASSTMNVAH